MPANPTKVRIDKWLWAARFFKTRNLAKQALEGGKVHMDGQRVKPSKDIEVGARLVIRQGWDEKEVIVEGLSEQRRGAPEAQQLYSETEQSLRKREEHAEQRKAAGGAIIRPQGRPNSKQRRQLAKIKRALSDDP